MSVDEREAERLRLLYANVQDQLRRSRRVLVNQLLEFVEATVSDLEQRRAQKALISNIMSEYRPTKGIQAEFDQYATAKGFTLLSEATTAWLDDIVEAPKNPYLDVT